MNRRRLLTLINDDMKKIPLVMCYYDNKWAYYCDDFTLIDQVANYKAGVTDTRVMLKKVLDTYDIYFTYYYGPTYNDECIEVQLYHDPVSTKSYRHGNTNNDPYYIQFGFGNNTDSSTIATYYNKEDSSTASYVYGRYPYTGSTFDV